MCPMAEKVHNCSGDILDLKHARYVAQLISASVSVKSI